MEMVLIVVAKNERPENGRDPLDKRACFDFDIAFSNGGGIQGQDFRLDITGDEISDDALAEYIIRDLRLLMVGSVRILNKRIIHERHKRAAQAAHEVAGQGWVIDLSHRIHSGQDCYPGLPRPIFSDLLSHDDSKSRYAEGVSFQIGKIEMVANTGTAIEAPYHRFATGPDVSGLPLMAVADLNAVVIRLQGSNQRAITAEQLAAVDFSGSAVLLDTGRARLWGTDDYLHDMPYLSESGASHLARHGAKLVGIDALNIDDTRDPAIPAHSILLGAGIPIVENLAALDALPNEGARFTAAPLRFAGLGACPVRAWARLPE